MPVDLRALYAQSRTISADAAENDRLFSDALRHYAREGDLLAYGLYVHGDQADELRALAYSRHGFLMAGDCEASALSMHVLAPEHGKTAFARWEAEMRLGVETEASFHDSRHTVPSGHYIMNTAMQAEKQIMEIEGTIEHNRRYRELFPTVRPCKRLGWTKDHFFVDRPRSRPDPSLHGCGMFGPIQGSRVNMQFVDDPTDQQDARSESLLKAQAEWLAGTAADRVMKRGIRRYRMTRWSEKDTFSRISKVQGLRVRVMPALDYWKDHPEYMVPHRALWPDVWDEARLEAKRQELIDSGQAYLWQLTWLCNPTAAEGDLFRREWIIYGTFASKASA